MTNSLLSTALMVTVAWVAMTTIALAFWSNTAQSAPANSAVRRASVVLVACAIFLGVALPKFLVLLRETTTEREAILVCVVILFPANLLLAFISRWAAPHVNDPKDRGIQGWRVGVLIASGVGLLQFAVASMVTFRYPDDDRLSVLRDLTIIAALIAPSFFASRILGYGARARPIPMDETPLRDELERIAYLIGISKILFEIVPYRSSRADSPHEGEMETLQIVGVGKMVGKKFQIPLAALQVLSPKDFTGLASLCLAELQYQSTLAYRVSFVAFCAFMFATFVTAIHMSASLASHLKLDLGWASVVVSVCIFTSILIPLLMMHFKFGPIMTRAIMTKAYHAWQPVGPPGEARDFVDLAVLALIRHGFVAKDKPTARLLRAAKRDRGLIAAAKDCEGLERDEFLSQLEHRLVARFETASLETDP